MKTTFKRVLVAVAILAGVAGCKRDEPVGPAQKAGAAIDNAGDKVAREVQDSLRKADEAADRMREKAKVTGEQIKEATEEATRDAKNGLDKATDEVGKKVEKAGEKMQDAARN